MPRPPSCSASLSFPALLAIAAVLPAPLLCGCEGELPPATRVDKLRVLAVRAEPPELAPGETTTLDMLAALPPPAPGKAEPALSYLWLACVPPAGSTYTRPCLLPSASETAALPARCADDPGASPCLLGAAPTASYLAPDLLGVDTETAPHLPPQRRVLVSAYVADDTTDALACARGAVPLGGGSPTPDHCVVSVKQVIVSREVEPYRNHNPTLTAFTLGGVALGGGEARYAIVADAAQLPVRLERADTAVERRPEKCSAAEPDPTTHTTTDPFEPPYVAWFISAGALDARRTTFYAAACDCACRRKDPPPLAVDTKWTQPDAADAARFAPGGEVRFWAVLHDGRGGVGWITGAARQR